jgi:hypothetical protein
MARQKGRQAAEETAKAECLRRWPLLILKCVARYYNGKLEGYVVIPGMSERLKPLGAARSAAEAWSECLSKLEQRYQ